MRDCAFSDYGLIITEPAAYELARQIFKPEEMKDWEHEKHGWYADIADEFGLQWVFEFTGSAFRFSDFGVDFGCAYEYCGDCILYAPLTKFPSLFRAVYNNMDEVISEFKNGIGENLPKNYDYRNNICHIVGTYYG